jgi:L-ribulokinase
VHRTVLEAQKAMTRTRPDAYRPDPHAADMYDRLFALYMKLHDAFGRGQNPPLGRVMKELLEIRASVAAS